MKVFDEFCAVLPATEAVAFYKRQRRLTTEKRESTLLRAAQTSLHLRRSAAGRESGSSTCLIFRL
jgi:hypothetical protein